MLFLENFLCGGNHNCDFSVKLSCGAEEAGWFFVKVFAREGRGSGKIFSAAKRVQTDVASRGWARAGILYPAAGQRKRGMPYHAVGQARAGMPYLAREKHKSSFFLIRKGRFWKNTQSRPKNGKKQPPQDVLRGIFVPGDIQLYESLLSIRSHILYPDQFRAAVPSVFRAVCRCPRDSDFYGLLDFTVHWSSTSLRFLHKGSGIF